MAVRILSTSPRRPYTAKRSANGIRTKHQIISEQAVSFGTHPYFTFCSNSGKPLCAEHGIAHFTYLWELTNLIRTLFYLTLQKI